MTIKKKNGVGRSYFCYLEKGINRSTLLLQGKKNDSVVHRQAHQQDNAVFNDYCNFKV